MVWGKVRRGILGGTPEWCEEEDCRFYGTASCTECDECTYCGADLGHHGRNRHESHVIARTSGGRKWVPSCMACNLSQRTDRLITWLRRLHEEDHGLYEQIVRHTRNRWTGWGGDFDTLARRIRDLDDELGYHW